MRTRMDEEERDYETVRRRMGEGKYLPLHLEWNGMNFMQFYGRRRV